MKGVTFTKIVTGAGTTFVALPALAVGELLTTGNTLLATVLLIVQQLVNISFIAILLAFFFGLAKFVWGGAEDKKVARNLMIWAVVALFIAASIWGLVRLLQDTVGITAAGNASITIPSATLP